MKITRITKAQKFGVFEDFTWNSSIPNFSQFNLIYGWNYSGKTTLSRILRCYEKGGIHADYKASIFEIEDDNGNRFPSSSLTSKNIKVFNSDFVEENINWGGDINPIFMLGEENIALQTELDEKRLAFAEVSARLSNNEKEKLTLSSLNATHLTARARDLKNELKLPNFDKRTLETYIERSLSENFNKLDDGTLFNHKKTLLDSEQKEMIGKISIADNRLPSFMKDSKLILEKIVSTGAIDRLKKDARLNEWVREGRTIHQGLDTCEFCGGVLPPDLMSRLTSHFSKEYDNFLQQIEAQKQLADNIEVKITLFDSVILYPEFQSQYSEKKEQLIKQIDFYNSGIGEIVSTLNEKKSQAFNSLFSPKVIDNFEEICTLIEAINDIIENHNGKTTSFQAVKQRAKEQILLNGALDALLATDYQSNLKSILGLSTLIETDTIFSNQLSDRIQQLEFLLSDSTKAATTINLTLQRYFAKEDIAVNATSDNKFQLIRNGVVAKNLSEGEKTAIAFSYFLTRLKDKSSLFSDSIVYIDDPISSLDSNHLFNTYAFIKDFFYEFDKNGTPKHKCKCKQLFIATHNFDFFNLIKDWFEDLKKPDREYYLVVRSNNSHSKESRIEKFNENRLKYKSDYSYLFSVIKDFEANPYPTFDQLFNLPNVTRRFLESFAAFKFLSTVNIEQHLDQIIIDPVERELVRKFVHYHTHYLSTARMERASDLSECVKAIGIVLQSVEAIDQIHYQSLMNSYLANGSSPGSPTPATGTPQV